MKAVVIFLLRGYQRWLSPLATLLGAQCRFSPTCSAFAIQMFRDLPWRRAAWATSCRLASCHPWHEDVGGNKGPIHSEGRPR